MICSANVMAQDDIDKQIANAEAKLPTDIRETNQLIDKLARDTLILTPQQSLRVDLLRIYSDITCGSVDRAESLINTIEQQRNSVTILSRLLYFRALIALKRFQFEKVFILLNRINQIPSDSVDIDHQFDVYILAANVHAQAFAYADAKGYATKALVMAHKTQTPARVCRALNSMAFIQQRSGDGDRIRALAQEVIEHCGETNEISELALAYRFLASWHHEHKEYIIEQSWLTRAIGYFNTLQSPIERSKTQLQLAKSLMLAGQLLDADGELTKALAFIELSSDIDAKTEAFHIKAQLLERMGLLDDAMFYFKRYLTAQRTISQQTASLNIAYLQRRFESKVNRQAIELEKSESQVSVLKHRQHELVNWVLLLSALLIAFILVAAFICFRGRQTFTLFESRQRDDLTQCYRGKYGIINAKKLCEVAKAKQQMVAAVVFRIDRMSSINDNYGHDTGDVLIQSFASKIKLYCASNGVIIRRENDEFLMFLRDCCSDRVSELVSELHQSMLEITIDNQLISGSISSGYAVSTQQELADSSILYERLVADCEHALAAASEEGGDSAYYCHNSTLQRLSTIGQQQNQQSQATHLPQG